MNPQMQPLVAQQDVLYGLAGSGGALYAARVSGLYRSRDGGAHWRNTFAALDAAETPAAVAVAVHGDTVLAGVNGAVLRSRDGGESWVVAALASPPPLVVALAVSPGFDADGIALAGTAEDGVFVTTDGAESWVPWNFGLIDKSVYALAVSPGFARDRTVFAGTATGLFASHNGGRGWVDLPFPDAAAPVQCLAFAPDGALFAGTEARGLYASTDGGQSWRRIAPDALPAGVQAITFVTQPEAGCFALLENGLLRSDDSGHTWRAHGPAFPPERVAAALAVTSAGGLHVGFLDGEIISVAS